MNEEVWHSIFGEWVKAYESLNFLANMGIVDEDETPQLKEKLFAEIIETCKSEIEE